MSTILIVRSVMRKKAKETKEAKNKQTIYKQSQTKKNGNYCNGSRRSSDQKREIISIRKGIKRSEKSTFGQFGYQREKWREKCLNVKPIYPKFCALLEKLDSEMQIWRQSDAGNNFVRTLNQYKIWNSANTICN